MHANAFTYINRSSGRRNGGRGAWPGNRDAVSDLHMANKTVSHFGQFGQAKMVDNEQKQQHRQKQKKNNQKGLKVMENIHDINGVTIL